MGDKKLNKYTRKIEREYMEILLDGVMTEIDDNGDPVNRKIPSMNSQYAQDYLVKALHGLSQEELDNLSPKEYDKKLEEANKEKNAPLE